MRLLDAEKSLIGTEGVGIWRSLVSALVGRRNQLVSELARAYKMGPSKPPPPLDADALERHIDSCWMAGGMCGGDDEAAHRHSVRSPDIVKRGREEKSVQSQPPRLVGGSYAARLAVVGLEIPVNIVRHILHGQDGLNSPDEETRLAAALGYIAHIVSHLSRYLDVPLRYPLVPAMSTSTLRDYAPLIAPEPAQEGGILSKGLHVIAAALTKPWEISVPHPGGSGPHMVKPAGGLEMRYQALELPLFSSTRGGGDRTQFALAVHLLNKDIEQLLQVMWTPCDISSPYFHHLACSVTASPLPHYTPTGL